MAVKKFPHKIMHVCSIRCTQVPKRSKHIWDAPDVSRYWEPFGVTPRKITANVLTIQKLSFLDYNLFSNKKLSKNTTLWYFAFERWTSQDMIWESWSCMTIEGLSYIKRSLLRILKQLSGRNAQLRTKVFFLFDELRQGRQFWWWALMQYTSHHCCRALQTLRQQKE